MPDTNKDVAAAGAGAQVPLPQNFSEAFLRLLTNQQALMTRMSEQLASTQQAIKSLSRDETVLDSLSSNMAEFAYNKVSGHTFDVWFSRYSDLFERDVTKLDNPAKTTKDPGEDYLAYPCRVNKACVDFKLPELTEEQFKCLTFTSPYLTDSGAGRRAVQQFGKPEAGYGTGGSTSSVLNMVTRPPKAKQPFHQSRSSSPHREPKTPCWSCGGMHFNKDCRFHDHKCQSCGKVGHHQQRCEEHEKKKRKTSTKTLAVHKVGDGRKFVDVNITNVPLRLQLDTGSDISILSHRSWVKLGKPKLCSVRCRAKTASGEPLDLTAELQCQITINGCTKSGIDWLELFDLWDRPISALCNKVDAPSTPSVSALQARFPEVFTSVMGLCNKSPVRLVLKGNPKPIFRPKRPVAYSTEALVEDELHRLQELEIIKLVNFSDWAAPVVVVRKPNGSVRICADFSTGLNDVLEPNQYPLPLPEDIFAEMSGCRFYSHIDLSDAYLQVLVDEDSQPLLTIKTHKGLF
ncbi:uncharacterized protein K02A2.6-like [Uranotaenia lowii]|uniref:uncharacterized protein K02A2.6-like n=1 Tax=Uranotaenia lowii TaxID=190385 RepID=UPI0024789B2F|nr:uncharacterized protein K02A2.6-like [Uranotaenia lowii]